MSRKFVVGDVVQSTITDNIYRITYVPKGNYYYKGIMLEKRYKCGRNRVGEKYDLRKRNLRLHKPRETDPDYKGLFI